MNKRFGRLPHDLAIFLLALASGMPAVLLSLWLIWTRFRLGLLPFLASAIILACWVSLAVMVRRRVVRPLQVMANLLLALREGDFSFRAHDVRPGDPLSDVLGELNTLSSVLLDQRRNALEATALLRTVMEEIDVAIFAVDGSRTLRLVNRAGEKLVGQSAETMMGQSAESLGLAACLSGEPNRILAASELPARSGRWGLRRKPFREDGLTHQLIVIADLSQPLRLEELQAWQRLVQVLGHELNNSLAPIKSIAGTLGTALRRQPRSADWEEDMQGGLEIIASRAEGLAQFLQAYSRLARLPPPNLRPSDLGEMIARVVALETRLPVTRQDGPVVALNCDAAQIEQSLINLVKNAVDASLERRASGVADAGVQLGWGLAEGFVEVRVVDDGPGIISSSNIFVPFFTTKPDGSGIGLVLCRQIVENHGGSITLQNRSASPGCVALVRLPLGAATS